MFTMDWEVSSLIHQHGSPMRWELNVSFILLHKQTLKQNSQQRHVLFLLLANSCLLLHNNRKTLCQSSYKPNKQFHALSGQWFPCWVRQVSEAKNCHTKLTSRKSFSPCFLLCHFSVNRNHLWPWTFYCMSSEWSGDLGSVSLIIKWLGKEHQLNSSHVKCKMLAWLLSCSCPDALAWSHIDSCLTSGQHSPGRSSRHAQRHQSTKSGTRLIGRDQGQKTQMKPPRTHKAML